MFSEEVAVRSQNISPINAVFLVTLALFVLVDYTKNSKRNLNLPWKWERCARFHSLYLELTIIVVNFFGNFCAVRQYTK